mgnify:CR=1 FL=1
MILVDWKKTDPIEEDGEPGRLPPDEFGEREEKGSRPFFDVHATIHVERDTQRAILLGHQGARLKEIGIRARADIERALAAKIFLGLHIKVSKEWQKDPKLLAKLGFGDRT